jgi:hypothetical protein
MKKIELNPDELAVTSFQTSAAGDEAGTVFGQQETAFTGCSCPGGTCQGYSCDTACTYTWDAPTCDMTCEGSWTCDTCDHTAWDTCPCR